MRHGCLKPKLAVPRRLSCKTRAVDAPLLWKPPEAALRGAKQVHPSHRLGFRHGLFWCWHCGRWGGQAPRLLRAACPLTPGKAGKEVLSRVRHNLTPKSACCWPLPDPLDHRDLGLLLGQRGLRESTS